MARDPVRILGVDTSLRCSGVGIIESDGVKSQAISYGVIKNPPKRSASESLAYLSTEINEVINTERPNLVAIEGIFYCRNVKTAVALGQARGVVIAAAALREIPVYEYSPRSVKKGVVGNGSATKEQVGQMVKKLLKLKALPPEDAADALAIAICHAHHLRVGEALNPPVI